MGRPISCLLLKYSTRVMSQLPLFSIRTSEHLLGTFTSWLSCHEHEVARQTAETSGSH